MQLSEVLGARRVNKGQIYLKLKESIRKKDSQIGDTERDRLIEHGKRIGVDVIFKQNDRQSLKLLK